MTRLAFAAAVIVPPLLKLAGLPIPWWLALAPAWSALTIAGVLLYQEFYSALCSR